MESDQHPRPSSPQIPILDYRSGASDYGYSPLYAVAIPIAVLMTVLFLALCVTIIPLDRLPLASVPIVHSPAKEIIRALPFIAGGILASVAMCLRRYEEYQTYAWGIWTGLAMSLLATAILTASVLGFLTAE